MGPSLRKKPPVIQFYTCRLSTMIYFFAFIIPCKQGTAGTSTPAELWRSFLWISIRGAAGDPRSIARKKDNRLSITGKHWKQGQNFLCWGMREKLEDKIWCPFFSFFCSFLFLIRKGNDILSILYTKCMHWTVTFLQSALTSVFSFRTTTFQIPVVVGCFTYNRLHFLYDLPI